MTKEELKQEAKDEAHIHWLAHPLKQEIFKQGYLACAESREKRIAELEMQIEKMKCCGNCKHCNEIRLYKGLEGKNVTSVCGMNEIKNVCDKWELKIN